jgi:hypothetical protein
MPLFKQSERCAMFLCHRDKDIHELASAADHELKPSMSQATPIVFVVDDDVSVRESLELLIRCEGWQPRSLLRVRANSGGQMPPGLWLAQTLSRQISSPRTETRSPIDRDRFAFMAGRRWSAIVAKAAIF